MAMTDQPKGDKSVGELLSDVAKDLTTLVRKELELAKLETKEELTRSAKAGGAIGAAGIAGWMGGIMLSFALAFLLDLFLPLWTAFLLVGALYGGVAWMLFQRGREQMKRVNPVPDETIESVKEDVRWLKQKR